MKIGMNDRVHFVLTKEGERQLRKHYTDLQCFPPKKMPTEMQLWEFMEIFGPALHIGGPMLIDRNELEIKT